MREGENMKKVKLIITAITLLSTMLMAGCGNPLVKKYACTPITSFSGEDNYIICRIDDRYCKITIEDDSEYLLAANKESFTITYSSLSGWKCNGEHVKVKGLTAEDADIYMKLAER